jgi:hypothetical protein
MTPEASSPLSQQGGPKRPYLLGGTANVISANEKAARGSSSELGSKFKIWRPNGGATPKAAPLPAALETSAVLAPAPLPPAPNIAGGYLKPVPRRFKRASAGGGGSDGVTEDVEEAVLMPAAAARACSVSTLPSPG